jgi:hypothetical protein
MKREKVVPTNPRWTQGTRRVKFECKGKRGNFLSQGKSRDKMKGGGRGIKMTLRQNPSGGRIKRK